MNIAITEPSAASSPFLLIPIRGEAASNLQDGILRALWEFSDPEAAARAKVEKENEQKILLKRIEELEYALAVSEHLRLVEEAGQASAESLAAGWGENDKESTP